MLVSLVASGLVWLLLLSAPWRDARLFSIGLTYVVLAGACMARLYVRPEMTAGQEIGNLCLLWLAAVALWTVLLALDDVDVLGALVFGTLIATPAFVIWQVLALALRGGWRGASSRAVRHHDDPDA